MQTQAIKDQAKFFKKCKVWTKTMTPTMMIVQMMKVIQRANMANQLVTTRAPLKVRRTHRRKMAEKQRRRQPMPEGRPEHPSLVLRKTAPPRVRKTEKVLTKRPPPPPIRGKQAQAATPMAERVRKSLVATKAKSKQDQQRQVLIRRRRKKTRTLTRKRKMTRKRRKRKTP